MHNLLGLDLATRLTGYCVGDGVMVPQAGAWEFPQVEDDLGQLGDLLWRRLDTISREADRSPSGPLGRVIYEAPILVVNDRNRGTDSLLTLRKLYGMGFLVETWCARNGIAYCEGDLRRIKKELTGSSQADKAAMVAAAVRLGVDLPAAKTKGREDAADAFGTWLYGIGHYAPPGLRADWDKRVWRAKGALL